LGVLLELNYKDAKPSSCFHEDWFVRYGDLNSFHWLTFVASYFLYSTIALRGVQNDFYPNAGEFMEETFDLPVENMGKDLPLKAVVITMAFRYRFMEVIFQDLPPTPWQI
jgi:hypothetical protein